MMDVGYILRRVTMESNYLKADNVAVQLESEEKWTYRELDKISNQYANALKELGVKKGDRVGVLLYNRLEYWGLYFAAAKIGAIVVRLNFRLGSEELKYALNDSGTKVLCFESAFNEVLSPIIEEVSVEDYVCLGEHPEWGQSWDTFENQSDTLTIDYTVRGKDPLMLMYTSGTTGRPKGALWTHANTLSWASMEVMKWGLNAETVSMTTGPLYHVGALEVLSMGTLLRGGKSIITKSGGFDIERVLNVLEKEKVNYSVTFPFMLYEMLALENRKDYKLTHMKTLFSGGDPVMPWAIERLNNEFPHINLVQVYGLTEGTPYVATLDPEYTVNKGHTVGKPFPLVEVKLMDDNEKEVSPGEVGEIWSKSPAVVSEYWNKPEDTKETFVENWCKTGDLGKIDSDGFLIISGRKKDMIRSGGENIYSAELEDVLYRHPKVKDVAIIGVPDPKYIETVCAVIVPKEGETVTLDDIVEYSKDHLAGYKIPRYVEVVDELPRTPSGKVTKYKLRERFEHLGKQPNLN